MGKIQPTYFFGVSNLHFTASFANSQAAHVLPLLIDLSATNFLRRLDLIMAPVSSYVVLPYEAIALTGVFFSLCAGFFCTL
jgi:Na+/H+ antiporter NhaA